MAKCIPGPPPLTDCSHRQNFQPTGSNQPLCVAGWVDSLGRSAPDVDKNKSPCDESAVLHMKLALPPVTADNPIICVFHFSSTNFENISNKFLIGISLLYLSFKKQLIRGSKNSTGKQLLDMLTGINVDKYLVLYLHPDIKI